MASFGSLACFRTESFFFTASVLDWMLVSLGWVVRMWCVALDAEAHPQQHHVSWYEARAIGPPAVELRTEDQQEEKAEEDENAESNSSVSNHEHSVLCLLPAF